MPAVPARANTAAATTQYGACDSTEMPPGDAFIIETPGGGGCGTPI
jgi:N-methylhydantoinase B/oxoprolinase/acetone carboxylase alpha subunit